MTTPDEEREALALGFAPEWAEAWGEDEVGLFASIVLGEVEQRMRWIPAGHFLMGSPEDEPGRRDNEGPQHTVKLSHGFWMADTPCTQALWEAIMGANPSEFTGPRRPVERVFGEDVETFLARLNERVPGLDAALPTEAQWEYACRAGTTTATYGKLDAVAWYSSNIDRKTHDVGLKQPNSWGLYDMLGNVSEWCADGLRLYQKSAVLDPTGSIGQDRVIRGGSWYRTPLRVRAAYRNWYRPGHYGSLGFRLVRAQPLRQDQTLPIPAEPQNVILRINIGERHHQWISETEARALVDDPAAICLSLNEDFSRDIATPRQWRSIAQKLDQLIADARAAAIGPVRYVIAGRAPLPVFAYLGASMVRVNPVVVANDFGGEWKLYGPLANCPAGGRDDFTVEPPGLGHLRQGRLALSVQCSYEYRSPDASVEALVAAENATFLGAYAIHNTTNSHKRVPLSAAELPVILGHVEQGLKWISEAAPDTDSVVIPLACPNWVAFWVGQQLNPAVCGRFDIPNFVPGSGYVRALSFPMAKAPWLAGKVRVLVMNAEPVEERNGYGATSFRAVRDAFEREVGAFELDYHGVAKVGEFMRDVERFKPDILHLYLHGGELVFEDEPGRVVSLAPESVVAMLRATGVEPALIILDACFSDTLAFKLVEIADCVIAMKTTISADKAIEFSRRLYEALGRGNSLAIAIQQGEIGADLMAEADPDIVEVHVREGVQIDEMILMPQPRARNP